jgi:hypothetical protein
MDSNVEQHAEHAPPLAKELHLEEGAPGQTQATFVGLG